MSETFHLWYIIVREEMNVHFAMNAFFLIVRILRRKSYRQVLRTHQSSHPQYSWPVDFLHAIIRFLIKRTVTARTTYIRKESARWICCNAYAARVHLMFVQ